jgi:D-xylose 1-dehydrogenase (NADP+, D-xylono-1,5-lactone-forming)
MPVKWGIISTARINRLFLTGARQSSDVEILAVASRSQTSAEEYARAESIPRAYDSYDALLADPDIEAVYIPLPNALHVEWSIRALEAGKHVLCEKPLSRHPAQIERAFDVAAAKDRILMEAFMYRHNPQTHRVRELVQAGAVGRLRMIRASFSFPLTREGDVRMASDLEGGGLMDVGSYCVSGARWLAGEPERVSAEQAIGGDGIDVTLAGTLRFPDDVLAHFDCGLALANRHDLEVTGDEGSLFVADPWHCRKPGIQLRRDDAEDEWIAFEPVDSYRLEAENLSAAIRGEAQPLLGRADALGQARAIKALYQAADSGQTVSLG